MDLMPHFEAIPCSASVSSFNRRMYGSNCAAALSKIGANCTQGPHQLAQQSTNTGSSFAVTCLEKLAAVKSSGLALNMADLHLPHLGLSANLLLGSLLVTLHTGQLILMVIYVYLLNYCFD